MKTLVRNSVFVLAVVMISLWFGSWLQLQAQGYNAHAHLSDVTDAITLGEHFTSIDEPTEEQMQAARATRAIIDRILWSSTPGPNAKARLEKLQVELPLRKYPADQR